jgi:murein DD-endopeptidase MepM/ murein hydrolase activator NlpD
MADSLQGLIAQLKQAEKVVDSLVSKSAKVNNNLNGGSGGPGSGGMPSAKDMSAAMGKRTALRTGGNLAAGAGTRIGMGLLGLQQPSSFDINGGPGQFERMQEIKRNNEAKMERMKDRAQTAYLGMRGISNRKTQVMYDSNGDPVLDANGQVKMQSRFSALSPAAQTNITSSMYGISDTLKLMQGMQNAFNTFLPSVEKTMGRAASYYNAGIYTGTAPGTIQDATFGRLKAMSAITSVGSDAKVAQLLASRGMSANQKVYGTTINTIGNAARYMNIANEEAAASIEGLTNAKGAAEMLRNFGIYTADLATGEEKSQGQIFEELAQRLTAGRGQATQEQTLKSIRRGALGVTIDSFFAGDKQGAQMFKQYMVDRSKGGNNVDLSSSTDVTSALSSKNPLAAQMAVDTSATEALGMSQEQYIKGINQASNALQVLNKAAGGLASALGASSAMIQTLFGSDTVKGLIGGASTLIDFTSKGIAGIGTALMGMDALNPAPALAQAGIIAGSMGLSLGAAVATTGVAQLIGGFGGFGGGNTVTRSIGGVGDGGSAGNLFDMGQVESGHGVNEALGTKRSDGTTHGGTDYNYSYGDAVKAVADGVVTVAVNTHKYQDNSGRSMGNYVCILHTAADGKEYTSIYGHLSEVFVSKDQVVTKGQTIGKAGNTGNTRPKATNYDPYAGTHLHFEIREGRQTVGGVGKSVSPQAAKTIGSTGASTLGSSNTPGASTSFALDQKLTQEQFTAAQSQMAVPGNVQGAMTALAGIYSGDTDKILSSLQAMSAGVGVTPSNWKAGLSQNPAIYSGAGPTPGTPGQPKQNTVNNNVSIVVQVPDVTSADAVKFAQLVKQYLDDNSLLSNTGGI